MNIKKFIKSSIIRLSDRSLPLGGELSEGGFCVIENFLPMEYSRESDDKILAFLNSSANVRAIVQDYTGRSDIEYYERWNAPTVSNSGIWHHDSVGHRVKAFIALTDSDEGTGTEILPSTHNNKYSDYNETRIAKIPCLDSVVITQKTGDLLLFDTNSIHRGIYGRGRRTIFQAEYDTGIKGRLLPGHVGRR